MPYKYEKYFGLAGLGKPAAMPTVPADARREAVWLDEAVIPGCMFSEACWYVAPCTEPGLFKHASDEVILLIGGNVDDPEELGATVELRIENDVLTLTKTCAVFIPEGCAHGELVVKDFRRPFFHFCCHLNTSEYENIPAEATEPAGKYAGNFAERYAPPDGQLPTAPEGFLKLLIFLDTHRIAGAPYMEAVWFCTTNDSGPEPHMHEDFDEFIGFMGTDPEHPELLNATVEFCLEDECIATDKSCVIYIPRGIKHSPIYVPAMDKPILHFSGGNGGDYVRKNEAGDSTGRVNNMYKK
ncbi:MAG: hypothetical protein HUJ65_03865 [Oscillospiraceae bacterium]|nr:hypothetical protein [Oscillospiraceae bacterium]